jgi:tetratricopeptide (TPR) repeat protein
MQRIPLFLFSILLVLCCSHARASNVNHKGIQRDTSTATKDYQSAIKNYTTAIKKGGKDKKTLASNYQNRGHMYANLGMYDKAFADYNMALKLDPKNGDAYWNRGVIFDSRGDNKNALSDYKNALALLKDKPWLNMAVLYCNIAYEQWMLGNLDDALHADSLSLALNPQYGRAYELKGNIHLSQKKYDSAIQDYTQAASNSRNDDPKVISELLSRRADAKREAKQYKQAINDYTLALEINADNGTAYWNRAATYHLNSDYELASADYTKAMTYFKDDNEQLSKLYDNRATNEMGQALYDKAIQDDSIAVALDSTNRNAYFTLSNLYTQNANYKASIKVLYKLVSFFPDNQKLQSALYYEIANNEYFLSEFDKVVDACTKAIKLNPDYASSYYYRGKVYLKKMNSKQLAMDDFNKVLALDTTKKSVDYIFALFYTGKGDEAAGILQSSLLSTNDDAAVLSDYYNLACLYALMNKPNEANIYLKKAIDAGYVKKYAMADEDLDNIRNTDDYKSTMASSSN